MSVKALHRLLRRLKYREFQRYGEDVLPGGRKHEDSATFLNWAALYDEAGTEVRSKVLHEKWMSELNCSILRLEGDFSVNERVDMVMDYMREHFAKM